MSSKAKLHARRRAARFGDLDALLAEALRDQRRGEGAVKRLKGVNMAVHQAYTDPNNWIDRGIVLIIYVDEKTGEQQTVGLFQDSEYKGLLRHGRKLTRINVADAAAVRQEVVHDPFMIRGKVDPCPPIVDKDPLAQLAIRAYIARTKEQQSLSEFLGGDTKAKIDAAKLLNQLHSMQLEKEI